MDEPVDVAPEFLARAVELAVASATDGQQPFGALIVHDGEVLATGVNTVVRDSDPTAHAEVIAVRTAARRGREVDQPGTVLVSSCEPCPLCEAAAWIVGISQIVYAAPKEVALEHGFRLPERAARMQAAWREAAPAGSVRHVPTPGAEEPFARFAERGGHARFLE